MCQTPIGLFSHIYSHYVSSTFPFCPSHWVPVDIPEFFLAVPIPSGFCPESLAEQQQGCWEWEEWLGLGQHPKSPRWAWVSQPPTSVLWLRMSIPYSLWDRRDTVYRWKSWKEKWPTIFGVCNTIAKATPSRTLPRQCVLRAGEVSAGPALWKHSWQ